jgi:Holliday junction resolvase
MTNSRAKGARYEREISHILNDNGFPSRRGQQFCGANGDPDVVSTFPFHIEAKRVEKLNLYQAMTQSISDSKGKKPPCVIHRKNNSENLITLRLDDLLELLNKN